VEDIPGEDAKPCLWRDQAAKANEANKCHGKANWHAEKKEDNQSNNAYDANSNWAHFFMSQPLF
jgi:hypothetical protein